MLAFHATFDTIFIAVGDLQKNDAHFHFSSVIFILWYPICILRGAIFISRYPICILGGAIFILRYPICIFRGVIFILKYLICISHL